MEVLLRNASNLPSFTGHHTPGTRARYIKQNNFLFNGTWWTMRNKYKETTGKCTTLYSEKRKEGNNGFSS